MSTESEEDTAMILEKRLGTCEACNSKPAKYTCPRCEVKTCSLNCLNLHKRELKCDGVRDKTKYLPLAKMTKMDLMNDYYFLEECTKFVEDRKRDRNKGYTRYNKNLPTHLFRLRQAANNRQISLRFLLQNFTKRQKNTSQLDFKSGVIYWRVEWCFPNGKEALLFVDDRLCENVKLYEAVGKYLHPDTNDTFPGKAKLTNYQSRGLSGLQLLLKAEGIKRCRNRFFLLDINSTIRECLAGKTVVEYPTIYVVVKDQLEEYNVVESDDDVEGETRQHIHDINKYSDFPQSHQAVQAVATDVIAGQLDQMNIDRTHIDKGKVLEKQPCAKPVHMNFLFSIESIVDEPSSESDQGNLTEEENAVTSTKRPKTSE
uniref:Box C/D snoRNA protein 1 n=1 Tax=Anopheles atroparvus TaxID=41427 RepID=A0AAG5DTN7_ANOAO